MEIEINEFKCGFCKIKENAKIDIDSFDEFKKLQKLYRCQKCEFEKRRAIRASVGGAGGVLASVTCQRGWHGWRTCVDGVLAWVEWVACYYYCYCYY